MQVITIQCTQTCKTQTISKIYYTKSPFKNHRDSLHISLSYIHMWGEKKVDWIAVSYIHLKTSNMISLLDQLKYT